MSQPDPYLQCVNCFNAFDIHNPNAHPHILRCKHNMCTRCLRDFISDLTTLKSSNIYHSSSNLTCTLCREISPFDNEGINRFPVNKEILNYLGQIQTLNKLEHESNAAERALEKFDNRLKRDTADLNKIISNGLTEMEQHHAYLSKRLTDEYRYSVHTFTQKYTRIRKKFDTDMNLIQSHKNGIAHIMRNRDMSHSGINQLQKSIIDSDSLINKLYQHSNLSEMDNLNAIVVNFKDKSIHTQHTSPTLPAIHTAQGIYTQREQPFPSNELSRSVDRSYSQTRLPVDMHSIYDCRALTPNNSRVSTVPENSYRHSISPVPWNQSPTHPKQPLIPPTKSCLSPTRASIPSNNFGVSPLSQSHSPLFLSPTHSTARPFLPPRSFPLDSLNKIPPISQPQELINT